MKTLAKILLTVGVLMLVVAVLSKLMNAPLLGSLPSSILGFADTCLLLAIGVLLLEEKK